MAMCSVSLRRLWRGRYASIGCSLPRRILFDFYSEPMGGDGRLLSRSESDQTSKDLPTVRVAPNLQARCCAQHDAADLEFGHSELRNDFELWGIRLRLKHKG